MTTMLGFCYANADALINVAAATAANEPNTIFLIGPINLISSRLGTEKTPVAAFATPVTQFSRLHLPRLPSLTQIKEEY